MVEPTPEREGLPVSVRAEAFERRRQAILMALATIGLLATGVLFYALWENRFDSVATDFVLTNWRVVFGVPFSAFGAFVVVALFRQGKEPFEFEGLGFKFRGSSGEIILWALCFLVLAGAVKMLS